MPGGGGTGETNTTSGAVGGSGNASVTLEVGGLEPFNTKGEAQNLSQRWKKWKRAFNLYVTGKGVSNDAQKRALLLHVAGMDVQEIYFTLAGEGEGTDFEVTLKVLDDYFVPKANIPFERHLFRQISQENGETVDQFVCRLRQRAATCEFGANEGDYIRDQLIDRCYSSHLRRKFLEKEGTVTLDDLLRIARSQEAVDRQLKQYNDQVDQNQVNAVNGKGDGNKTHRKERHDSVVDRKDISVKTRSARHVVKLAGSAVERVISELNALNFISVAVVIRDREVRRIAQVDKAGEARVPVDPVEVEVNAEEGERQTL